MLCTQCKFSCCCFRLTHLLCTTTRQKNTLDIYSQRVEREREWVSVRASYWSIEEISGHVEVHNENAFSLALHVPIFSSSPTISTRREKVVSMYFGFPFTKLLWGYNVSAAILLCCFANHDKAKLKPIIKYFLTWGNRNHQFEFFVSKFLLFIH